MKTVQDYYKKRFPQKELQQKQLIWKVVCEDYLQHFVGKNDVVIDIGAGYCEFINNITCGRKIAIDINPDTKKFAGKDVEVVAAKSVDIPKKFNGKADIVFMSNFLEHLSTKEEIISTLEKSYELLKKGGHIMIMQPNISLVKERYWDFIDHKMALNTESVVEALEIAGFRSEVIIKRFLPYATKARLPKWPIFIKTYLAVPSVLRPFAGQSFFVAIKK